MCKNNHEATNVGTNTSVSRFTTTQKETDALNHGGDVSMTIFTPKTDVVLMVHPCEMENLISVPVDYAAMEVEQHPILEQARGAACETLNAQMVKCGKDWHVTHISLHMLPT